MTGRTGYTAPTNASAANFATDLANVYAWFDALVGESKANAAALPSSGNWVGRLITTVDTGAVYVCTATPGTWALLVKPFTTYTPTLTNITGTPTVVARWGQVAKRVFVSIDTTLTGATIGTDPGWSTPVSARSFAGFPILGHASMYDISPVNIVSGNVYLETVDRVTASPINVAGTYASLNSNTSATVPFTWASGDIIRMEFSYEAA